MMEVKDKQRVLNLVRQQLECMADGYSQCGFEVHLPWLSDEGGAFISFISKGELMAFAGHLEPVVSIRETLTLACEEVMAQLNLAQVDLSQGTLELAFPSVERRLCHDDKVIPSLHGLAMRYNGLKGICLPRMAINHGWSVHEYMEATCRRAGASMALWEDGQVTATWFEVEIIEEILKKSEYPLEELA